MAGVKRVSSGVDDEKDPFANVDITDEDNKKLQEFVKLGARVDLALERDAQKKLDVVFTQRRDVLKSIDRFWPIALRNNATLGEFTELNKDQQALSYLEDLWIVRNEKDFRVFTIEFYFKPNPFFKDAVLKKEYKFTPANSASDETPDENGITESMIDFSWERDVEAVATNIQWTDDAHNLVKLYPRKEVQVEDDKDVAEHGSFFNYFHHAEDLYDFGVIISSIIFPDAINYFLGTAEENMDDEISEGSDSDDDDDAEEIDLEKPRSKKQKHA